MCLVSNKIFASYQLIFVMYILGWGFSLFDGCVKSLKTTPANFKQKALKSFTSDKISVLCFPQRKAKPIWNPIPSPLSPLLSSAPSVALSLWTTSLLYSLIGPKVTNSNFTILFFGFTNILRASVHTESEYFIQRRVCWTGFTKPMSIQI